MEIITKFKVDDIIYTIYRNPSDGQYFIKEIKIDSITCYVERNNIIKINYSIHDLRWEMDTDYITEESCFATMEEAQRVCDRRNSENKNNE